MTLNLKVVLIYMHLIFIKYYTNGQTVLPDMDSRNDNCHGNMSYSVRNITIRGERTQSIIEMVCNAFLERPQVMQVNANCCTTIFITGMLRNFGVAFTSAVDKYICPSAAHRKRPTSLNDIFVVRSTLSTLIIDAILDLIVYWKWHTTLWLYDLQSGVKEQDINYRRHIRGMNMESLNFAFVDVNDSFVAMLMSKKRSGYVIAVGSQRILDKLIQQMSVNRIVEQTSWIIVNPVWPSVFFPTYLESIQRTQITLVQTQISPDLVKTCVNLTGFNNWETVSAMCAGKKAVDILTADSNEPSLLENNMTLTFHDVFFSSKTSKIEIIKFAQWNVNDGLYFVQRVQSKEHLKFRSIVATSCLHEPFIIITGNEVSGYLGAFFSTVADILGFNLSTKIYEICYYGESVNGTWTGLIGHTVDKKFDFILLTFGMTSLRNEVLYFTPSVYSTDMRLIIQTSNMAIYTSQINYNLYMKPFHYMVWVILLVLLVIATAVWILGYIIFYKKLEDNWTWWILSGTVLVDVFYSDINKVSSRVLLFTIMLTAYLSYCCYSSVLISFLAIEEEILPFRNLEEMAEIEDYNLVIMKGTTFADYFMNSKPGTPQAKLWQRLLLNSDANLVPNLQGVLERIHSNEKCAGIVELNNRILNLIPGRSYKFIPGSIGIKEIDYMGIRTDFPYRHIVSNKILHMKETGLMDRFKKIHVTEWETPKIDREIILGLKDVASLCILLATGIVLSLLTFLIELMCFHCRRKSDVFVTVLKENKVNAKLVWN